MSGSRILVTDAQERSMLAAIRCLGDAGLRVTAAADARLAPGLWSRSCSSRRILPDLSISVAEFIEQLVTIVRREPYQALLAGSDATLYAVSRDRSLLAPFVELGLPEHDVVLRALDKTAFARDAAKVGFATPDAVVCDRYEEALAAAQAFRFPLLVKPAQTVVGVDGGLARRGTVLVGDERALHEALGVFGACIVQRRSSGRVIGFGGVATPDGLLGSVASRYRRIWPPDAGNACFSTTFTPSAELARLVQALVAEIGWQGLFQLELIEGNDGSIQAIDFNPRAYGSMGLAGAAGAPLTALWCAWLRGEQPEPVVARPDVQYRWEDADARHIFWQLRGRDYRGAVRAVAPRRGVAHAFAKARDPLPLLVRGAQLASQRGLRERLRSTATRAVGGAAKSSAGRASGPSQPNSQPPARGTEAAERLFLEPLESLESGRDSWTMLAERTANISSTWEWADVWWRHFGRGRRLSLAAVRTPDRGIIAVLPLYAEGHHLPIPITRFVGHGVADQLGPVCDPSDAGTLAWALQSIGGRRGIFLGERLPGAHDWERELGGRVLRSEISPAIALVDEGDWDDYLGARSSNFRQQVRRRARRLASGLGVTFRLADDPARLDADFDTLVALHEARWAGRSSAFAGARRAFHRDFAAAALRAGWLRLWMAEADGTAVAAWYGFRFAGVESYYQSGRDPAWERHSVGAGLLEHSIREAFVDGMREYRLLRGDEGYKQRYASSAEMVTTVAVPYGELSRIALAAAVAVAPTARAGLARLRSR
jgi:CelD/BcsL family acetyltransferase involved in cellulose biosynthesis/predicted ATP-grasp superfamily ATP-dependent carboligase